jgi:hypothetical protein
MAPMALPAMAFMDAANTLEKTSMFVPGDYGLVHGGFNNLP